MKCFRILIFLIFIYILPTNAQNPIGLSQITNFTKLDYKGGNQNWDIQQDSYGIMYFANNEIKPSFIAKLTGLILGSPEFQRR